MQRGHVLKPFLTRIQFLCPVTSKIVIAKGGKEKQNIFTIMSKFHPSSSYRFNAVVITYVMFDAGNANVKYTHLIHVIDKSAMFSQHVQNIAMSG